MLAKVHTAAAVGLDGEVVEVEVEPSLKQIREARPAHETARTDTSGH